MVDTKTTEPARHRAPEDFPTFVGDLATGYDILRAHYVAESDRQRAVVQDASFALDALERRRLVDPTSVPQWKVTRAVRAVQDAQAVQGHLGRMLARYPERNRDMTAVPARHAAEVAS